MSRRDGPSQSADGWERVGDDADGAGEAETGFGLGGMWDAVWGGGASAPDAAPQDAETEAGECVWGASASAVLRASHAPACWVGEACSAPGWVGAPMESRAWRLAVLHVPRSLDSTVFLPLSLSLCAYVYRLLSLPLVNMSAHLSWYLLTACSSPRSLFISSSLLNVCVVVGLSLRVFLSVALYALKCLSRYLVPHASMLHIAVD